MGNGFRTASRALAISLLFIIGTLLQGVWALAPFASNPPSDMGRYSLAEELLVHALLLIPFLLFARWIGKRITHRMLRVALATLLTMLAWYLVDVSIFDNRVANWSTYTSLEMGIEVLWYAALPVMVVGAGFGTALALSKLGVGLLEV
ncbi:hypothetical protein ACPA5B_21025 [Pseudomonas solani]|uniref:hypothetical protein n=1 Tax=Pseudomonas solani TaxID=2731552 RepID=UPI003C2E0D9B